MDAILEMLSQPLMLPISLALLGGILALVLSRWAVVGKVLAVAAGVAVLFCGVRIAQLPVGESLAWTWIDLGQNLRLTLDLAPTNLGLIVLFGAAAFSLLITVYSFHAMAGHWAEKKFYPCVIWALAGACMVALAGNLLVLLIGWEIVTLVLFLMINQGGKAAGAGAAKTYGMLGFADACLLLAVALLMTLDGGSANLSFTRPAMAVGSMGTMGYVVYVLILIAALAKAGAVPLHTWIPAAAERAPAAATAYLPGSVDKLMGIYLLAVLVFRMFQPDAAMGTVLMCIGCVTLLAAGLMALTADNVYRALAFDAVSQVGYMAIGIGVGAWLLAGGGPGASALAALAVGGALFHMLNHAIYKSALFLVAGAAARTAGTAEMSDMGGLVRIMPVTFVCGVLAALAAAGIPLFNGFASKWMVYQGVLSMRTGGAMAVLVIAVFASALSLALFLKILHAVFLSPRPDGLSRLTCGKESILMAIPMIVLAAVCVALGLRPDIAVEGVFVPAMAEMGIAGSDAGDLVSSGAGIWDPGLATGLLVIGLLMGAVLLWLATRRSSVRVVRPFIGGEAPLPVTVSARPAHDTAGQPDRYRVPGTHFYETIERLPIMGPLLKHGQQGAMDLYHWSARHGKTFVEMLRAQHTGLINLYVAWVLVGLTVTLAFLLVNMGS